VLRRWRTQVKTARWVFTSINGLVREIVEWSGGALSSQTPRKSRNAKESAARHAMHAVAVIVEVVADKGSHSRQAFYDLETLDIRSYISEPNRGSQSWIDQRPSTRQSMRIADASAVSAGKTAPQARRTRGAPSAALLSDDRIASVVHPDCGHRPTRFDEPGLDRVKRSHVAAASRTTEGSKYKAAS
jgi:hypothetical protein